MLEAHSLFRGYGKAKKANFSTYIVQLYSSEQAGNQISTVWQPYLKGFRKILDTLWKDMARQNHTKQLVKHLYFMRKTESHNSIVICPM